jgi:hypothetical protein
MFIVVMYYVLPMYHVIPIFKIDENVVCHTDRFKCLSFQFGNEDLAIGLYRHGGRRGKRSDELSRGTNYAWTTVQA